MVKAFKFFDISNSGEVDFPTFQKAIGKMGVVVDESDLNQYFRAYDSNRSGTLDYKEFSDVVFGKAQVQAPFNNGGQASQGSANLKFKGLVE